MAWETAEAQLNGFLDRQAAKVKEQRAGQEHANALEAMWRAGDERRAAQMHKENQALWYVHFCRMAENHRKLSEDYEARAEALCREGDAAWASGAVSKPWRGGYLRSNRSRRVGAKQGSG